MLDIAEFKDAAEIEVEKEKTSEELIVVRGSSKTKVSILEIQ